MHNNILNYFFQGIPELVALLFTAFVIANHPVNWKRIVVYGSILAALAWLFRMFQFPFGLHSVFILLLIGYFLRSETKKTFKVSFFSAFIAMFLLLVLELGFHLIMEKVLEMKIDMTHWSWIFMGWPQIIGLLAIALGIKKWNGNTPG